MPHHQHGIKAAHESDSSAHQRCPFNQLFTDGSRGEEKRSVFLCFKFCWLSWSFYDVVSTVESTFCFYDLIAPCCGRGLQRLIEPPHPYKIQFLYLKGYHLGSMKFLQAFQLHCNKRKKNKKLWLCLKERYPLGGTMLSCHSCARAAAACRSTVRWRWCAEMRTLWHLLLCKFDFFSSCEYIAACASALTFFNPQPTRNFGGNLKGNSDVQIRLVVYQGKVAKWLFRAFRCLLLFEQT